MNCEPTTRPMQLLSMMIQSVSYVFQKKLTSKSTPDTTGHALLSAEVTLTEMVWIKLVQKRMVSECRGRPNVGETESSKGF